MCADMIRGKACTGTQADSHKDYLQYLSTHSAQVDFLNFTFYILLFLYFFFFLIAGTPPPIKVSANYLLKTSQLKETLCSETLRTANQGAFEVVQESGKEDREASGGGVMEGQGERGRRGAGERS